MNSSETHPYWILAFYCLEPIADPQKEVKAHKKFFETIDVASRIYISEAGINAQMSIHKDDAKKYMEWMEGRPPFSGIRYKIDAHKEHAFPRKTVKYRKKLVAIDEEIDFSQTGALISPEEWKRMLDASDLPKVVIDVRNEYEWKVGHFEGAELPPCETFREFKGYSEKLSQEIDPKETAVMMYCTGGIRCELYSSILKKQGFEKIYQLDGGVINYGHKVGSSKWRGKLFVFDDRLVVPVGKEETEVIASCHHCQKPAESYHNCANMDCNHLFICCANCLPKCQGCCKEECQTSARIRPYHEVNSHKPFRKWHHYFDKK